MKCKLSLNIGLVLIILNGAAAFGQSNSSLEHDIQLLIAEKNSRTPVQQKIDSRLLQAVRENRGQKMVEGLNLEPAKVNADITGKLKVDIRGNITDNVITRIENLGGSILFSSFKYNYIRAEIRFPMVENIAAFPEVKFIEPAAEALTVGSDRTLCDVTIKLKEFFPFRTRPTLEQRKDNVRVQLQNYLRSKNLRSGSANSQGDRAHRADDARNTFGYEGQGIRIGVMSDSYNALGAAQTDVQNGDLPGAENPYGNTTPVTVLSDVVGSDEGRAMMQIVHDVAPKARLYYASAFLGDVAFATSIQDLRNAPNNCDIIIDDIFYFNEPAFQDGVIADAVNTVTAGGALYFSSASNSGSLAKGTSGYYEEDFNDNGSPVFNFPGGTKAGTTHNFGTAVTPLDGDIIQAKGNAYNLHWADPNGASSNDYDLFLVSTTGTIKQQSTNIQSGSQNPYEQLSSTPALVAGDKLVVFKTASAATLAFAINTIRGKLAIATAGETHGHSTAINAFGVAATPASTPFSVTTPVGPFPSGFIASNQVETFSSDGFRRVFFNANSTAITPGNFLFKTNGGSVRNKPDITAADGVSTTLPGASGLNPFYGTSAAAPHAGAIAALLKSANPALTATQIRTALTSTALDIEGPGFDVNSGFGIVQAFQAMQFINPAVIANLTLGNVTVTEGAGTNGNGEVEPGETGSMLIQINDPSLANATAVSAVLSTTTSGVTITQPNATYGNIVASGSVTNSTAYTFSISNTVACASMVNFTLTVNYSGGASASKVFIFSRFAGSQGYTINTTLGTPITASGYSANTGQQTGRLSRSGVASTCAAPKINPGLTTAVGARQFDAYTFTNTNSASQCVSVTLTSNNGGNLYSAAFTNAGFIPAVPNTNYLADPGTSSYSTNFSFTAVAGQPFTVVVHDITPGTNSAFAYSLNVGLSLCSGAVVPVTWIDVKAQLVKDQVAVQWKVANEINVSKYELEYSTDGNRFNKLYTVAATQALANEKVYSQTHNLPEEGMNYYRIKEIDKDGRSTYSKTVSVKISNPALISVAPNPATDFVTVQSKALMIRLQLLNNAGQIVTDVVPSSSNYNLPVSNLPAGQYILRVQTAKGIINTKLNKK